MAKQFVCYIHENRFGNYLVILGSLALSRNVSAARVVPLAESNVKFIQLEQAQQTLFERAPAGALLFPEPVDVPLVDVRISHLQAVNPRAVYQRR